MAEKVLYLVRGLMPRHIARRAGAAAGGGWVDNTMTNPQSISNWPQLFVVLAKMDDTV